MITNLKVISELKSVSRLKILPEVGPRSHFAALVTMNKSGTRFQ